MAQGVRQHKGGLTVWGKIAVKVPLDPRSGMAEMIFCTVLRALEKCRRAVRCVKQ